MKAFSEEQVQQVTKVERYEELHLLHVSFLYTKRQNFRPVQLSSICNDKTSTGETMKLISRSVQNLVGKGENAFSLFPFGFHRAFFCY